MKYPSWLFAALLLTIAPAQNPPRDQTPPPPQPTGTGRISGVVVAADNGAPVKRATVTVVGYGGPPRPLGPGVVGSIEMGATITFTGGVVQSGGSRWPVKVTDEAGRFEFTDLAPGSYSLQVMAQTGFVRSERVPPLRVTDDQTATITFRLARTGAISGRILDEGGDPLPRARVMATRRGPGTAMSVSNSVTTDDLGRYRMFDLAPGDYLVTATAQEIGFLAQTPVGSPGFAPTYYPGSATLQGAQAVAVTSGGDNGGVDFSLVRVPMGQVTGTVRDAAGDMVTTGRGGAPGASVTLTARPAVMPTGSRGASVRPDGTFTITAVPPGNYYLSATVTRGTGPDAIREGAFVPIAVNGDEVRVDVRTNTGATIRGRVVIEGTPPVMPPLPPGMAERGFGRQSVMVQFVADGAPMSGNSPRPAQVEEDGTFVLTGVRGSVALNASGFRTVLKSVLLGGREVAGKVIEFKGTEDIQNAVITFTTEVGRLGGTVEGFDPKVQPDTWVIAFSDDPEHWFRGSPFVYFTRPMGEPPSGMSPRPPGAPPYPAAGSFMMPPMAPGRYYVGAVVAALGGMPPQDRSTLEKIREAAKLVSVGAGQTVTVQVRLNKQ